MSLSPNILFLFTDQQRPDALGVVNPHIKTPAMDSIARRGIKFSQATCNAPVCMPSRHSLFSGIYPSALGNTCNGIEMPQNMPLFPQFLKEGGYWTASVGKLHFLNHSNRDHRLPHPSYGFDRVENSDEPGCYEDAYIEWVSRKDPKAVENCRCTSPPICEGSRIEVEGREVDEPYAFRGPEDLSHSAFVAERTIQAIKDSPQDRPFFINAGFYAPHAPLNPPKRLWDYYRKQDLPMPAWDAQMQPSKAGDIGPRGHSVQQWKEIIAAYYALTTHVDEQVGKILNHLEETGQRDNTLIVFASDHGEFLGDHGRIQKGPPGNDCIIRVPLLVEWAERLEADQQSDACVELIDLAPTFLELAGLAVPSAFQGKSLKPLLLGGSKWSRQSNYQEYTKNGYGWMTVRNAQYTYARSTTNEEIFWNRNRDPHEFINFINDPKEADAIEKMQKELEYRIPKNKRESRPMTGSY